MKDLLRKLKEHNIHISLHNDDLKVKFNDSKLPAELLSEIRNNKAEIIAYLKNNVAHREADRSITATSVKPCYAMSSAQRRLWFLSQFRDGSIAYNMPAIYVFNGKFDRFVLGKAFEKLIERHEILRTVFREDENGEIRQWINAAATTAFKISFRDIRMEEQKKKILEKIVESESNKPFDLENGPLLRASLVQMEDEKYIFVYVMHHSISDGWSMQVLLGDLLTFYHATGENIHAALEPLRIHYKDYSEWQQQQLSAGSIMSHKQYWLSRFEGELPVLQFPGDKPRPLVKTYNGKVVNSVIRNEVTDGLKSLLLSSGGTLFMGLLGAVNILLYKYTGQEDLVIGTPIAGREHPDLQDQIGIYLNTLALRNQLSGQDSVQEVIEKIKHTTLGAYEHQLYPFDELVDELKLQRDMSRNALFDVMVVLQNTDISNSKAREPQPGQLSVEHYAGEKQVVSLVDLTFTFIEISEGLHLRLEYNTDIYNEKTILRLSSHFKQLLESMLREPSCSISHLDIMAEDEKQKLLHSFNATAAAFPEDKTLIALFEEQVKIRPAETALIHNGLTFSYSQLNENANRLGHYLRTAYNIRPNDLVAIRLTRSEWMPISILGILKSGGAYIPVAPDYPQERVNYIVNDAKCKVIIDDTELLKFRTVAPEYPSENLIQVNTPSDLAYVIYTSGSTGEPKGCMLENRGVVNRIDWMWKHYGFSKKDIILQKTTCTFDVSVWEIFMPLCYGAKMVLCKDEDIASPARITELIARHKVSCLHFVPSMLNAFIADMFEDEKNIQSLKSLKYVITSGEALAVITVKQWYEKMNAVIHNLYGPTEASVDVTFFETSVKDVKIPIGRPIANIQMYVLGNSRELLPLGAIGEIAIGGIGLARGYLNKPELSSEKFVDNPFVHGEKIYRTGDLGRWQEDGNIEYLGRIDGQVKIRGYRIETGEIENALRSNEKISDAVVTAHAFANNEKELVAYLVGKETLALAELRSYLAAKLPAYMLPAHYVQLPELPLTTSGKVNRKLLPSPQSAALAANTEYIAPRNETEQKIVAIWKELLEKESIGITDNFFDIGGNSIKIIRLSKMVSKALNMEVPIPLLFQYSNIKSLIEYMFREQEAPLEEEFDNTSLTGDLNKFNIE